MHAVPECSAVRNLLEDYFENQLTETDEERVRAHLATCDECRELAAETDPSVVFLALREQSQSEFFWAGMWRDLQEGIEANPRSGTGSVLRDSRSILRVAAAVIVGVGILGLVALYGPITGPGSLPEVKPAPTQVQTPVPAEEPPTFTARSDGVQWAIPDDPNAKIVEIEAGIPIVMVYSESIDI